MVAVVLLNAAPHEHSQPTWDAGLIAPSACGRRPGLSAPRPKHNHCWAADR